jgi:phosphatidyl-myo-inositol dimannoside synthase
MPALKPRLLILTPVFPPATGGVETVVHRITENLHALRPRVVTLDHPDAREFDTAQPFEVRRVGADANHKISVGTVNAVSVAEAVRFRPDVVLSGHIVTAPAAAAISKVMRRPYVQYLYCQEIAARPRLASFAIRHARTTIAISRYTQDLARAISGGAGRFRLVPCGVDFPESRQRVNGGTPHGRPTVLTVARLVDRYKGHDVMLRAIPLIAARVPDFLWVIVGDGRLRPELERRAMAQGVADNVDFVGQVSDADRNALFERASVFAMPSRTTARGAGEGFGIVFLEANFHGLPVVAGSAGGTVDAVEDGETGVLVDPRDHVALAHAIADLLLDRERARRLGAAGAARVRRDFSWPSVAERVESILMSVAER